MPRKSKQKKEAAVEIPVDTSATERAVPHEDAIFKQEGELVCDVFENHKEFVVLAAIAGVAIKDLDISVEKEMMVIKGTRVNPHHHADNTFVAQECWWGPFSKKIVLPENINTEAADASMDKGILTIKIPKVLGKPQDKQVELS